MAKTATTPESRVPTVTSDDLDRINLSQALRDFEVANARVVDLTARLTETHQRLVNVQHELSLTRVHVGDLNAIIETQRGAAQQIVDLNNELAAIRRSRSFRLAVHMSRVARRVMP